MLKPKPCKRDYSEEELADGLLNGNREIVECIYWRLHRSLNKHIRKEHLRHDAITEAIRIWLEATSSGRYRRDNLVGFLYLVAFRKWLDSKTDRMDFSVAEMEALSATSEDTQQDEVEKELKLVALTECLEQLPEPLRLVIKLHYLDGVRYNRIGNSLGISETAARKRAFDGRGKIIECLKRKRKWQD